MSLWLGVEAGDVFTIGDDIALRISRGSRIGIDAPKNLRIDRSREELEPQDGSELLTPVELDALRRIDGLADVLRNIVSEGEARGRDIGRLMVGIDDLRRYVMSQAAARCYPERLRRLGDTWKDLAKE